MGASRELEAVRVEGMTRSAFILRGALAAGAAYGLGAVAPFVSDALGAAADDDQVLAFALTLEQLESAFYKAANARAKLSGQAAALAKSFGGHEDEHVKAISQLLSALGGKPPAASTAKFGLSDQASFLRLAVTLEDLGVAAYNGAAPLVKTPDILSALGSIVNVEARHSAALRTLAGQDPSPQAFEKGKPADQVAVELKTIVQ
jgi:rubrerythrin